MKKIYRYIYSFNPNFIKEHKGNVFAVEEYEVKEEQDFDENDGWKIDCKNTWWLVKYDGGISKRAVDCWKALYCDNSGKYAWSFTNSKEKMKEFQNIIMKQEQENLMSYVSKANHVKERIKKIIKNMNKD